MTKMKQLKETYINTLVDNMSMEDFKQYVKNDMSDFLCYCSESEVITNEFLLKVKYTTDEQFYNKFVKKIKWGVPVKYVSHTSSHRVQNTL